MRRLFAGISLAIAAWLIVQVPGMAVAADSCRQCHQDEKFRVQNKKLYEYYQEWRGSAHDLAGLSCSSCHGGDPSKEMMKDAHQGILPQSDPRSPFHYKNIPKTCGTCHPKVLERFQKSRHFEQLEASGRGPSCIVCHGSLDVRVYAMTAVDRSCVSCHNKETGNHPEVIDQAREILSRLNHANGYRKGLQFYYKNTNKLDAMTRVDKAYDDVVRFWHEFNFKKLGPRSKDLLAEIKSLYLKAHEERKDPEGESDAKP